MSDRGNFFEDLANVAGGAFVTLLKANTKVIEKFKTKVEPYINKADLVSREEYEYLLDMVLSLKQEQETLLNTINDLASKFEK